MPAKLSTIVKRVQTLKYGENRKLLLEFHEYMKQAGTSERHQGNELLAMFYYAQFIGDTPLMAINKRQQITAFLDTKKKPKEIDPDEEWITTWNDYLGTLKHSSRWLPIV